MIEMKTSKNSALDQTEEPEATFSLGKFFFDENDKLWSKKGGARKFMNPFKNYTRNATNPDVDISIAMEQGENCILDDQISLSFYFKLPIDDVKEKHPSAQFLVRMTAYAPADTQVQAALVEITEEQPIHLAVQTKAKGRTKHETILSNATGDKKVITFKLEKGSGKVYITAVEILVSPMPQLDSASSILTGGAIRQKGSMLGHPLRGTEWDENQLIDRAYTNRRSQESIVGHDDDDGRFKLLEQIRDKHEKNNLQNNLGAVQQAKQYLEKVEFKVPLNELYNIVASCHHTEGSLYCGLLLRIMDPKILEINEYRPYLLQIWKRGGQIIYEKSLDKPVCNWNITSDKFLFQEEPSSPEVTFISLHQEKQPKIYKFSFPPDVIQGQKNTYFDNNLGQFIVPTELAEQVDENEGDDSRRSDFESPLNIVEEIDETLHRMSFARGQVVPEVNPNHKASVSQLSAEKIIRRAPDKMMDFCEGFIVLAYRHMFLYFDVQQHLDDANENEHEKKVEIQMENLTTVAMKADKKIFCLQEIGLTESCIVTEDMGTRHVRFLRFEANEIGGVKKLKLIGLGMNNFDTSLEKSPMLKFRSSANFDPETGIWYFVAVVLRENGRLEFYSDFMYTDHLHDPAKQHVDIEVGAMNFYFKLVKNAQQIDQIKSYDDLKFAYSRVRQTWKNRIGPSTIKEMQKHQIDNWNQVMHKRFSQFVRLYSCMVNFSTFLIVAHRNMLSLYDMGQMNSWIDTVRVSDDWVRSVQIQKRPKNDRTFERRQTRIIMNESKAKSKSKIKKNEAKKNKSNISMLAKFEIACLFGSHGLAYTEIVTDDQEGSKFNPEMKNVKMKARVIRMVNDASNSFGMTLLTDDGPESEDFTKMYGSSTLLYKFPLIRSKAKSRDIQIQTLKMRRLWKLLTTEDQEAQHLIDYDCSFQILKSNRTIFHHRKQKGDKIMDHVRKNKDLKGKKSIKVLSLTLGRFTKHFPIVKERKSETKEINEVYVIKEPQNCREFKGVSLKEGKKHKITTLDEDNDLPPQEPIQQEFYATYKEFDKNKNSYLRVTQNSIQVFNKDKQLSLTFRNLNIRSAVQVHQKFIYACTDRETDPIVMTGKIADDSKGLQHFYKEGFYVFNVQALLQGRIERYKISRTTGGLCNLIEYSLYNERLAYQENYDAITVIPLPHLNTVNFIGMQKKHEYLIWREKRGFFTALDRRGALSTWSNLTGKLLYTIKQPENTEASMEALDEYDVYRADEGDIMYTRGFYTLENSSVNLLRSNKAVGEYSPEKIGTLVKGFNTDNLIKQMEKHDTKNKSSNINFAGMGQEPLSQLFQDSNEIDILNTTMRFDLFHFKVMELRTYEDTRDISECRLKFHFMHRLIAPDLDSDVHRGGKATEDSPRKQEDSGQIHQAFEWDQSQDPMQRLYLSRDTRRMMEAVNNSFAIVYARKNIGLDGLVIDELYGAEETEDHGQQVKWVVLYKIARWPSLLCQRTSTPYMFSPNFTYQMDFSYVDEQVVIMLTETQEVYMRLPVDMINTEWNDLSEYEAIDLIFARMKWEPDEGERRLRIATHNNLDCIFEMCSTDETDQDIEQRFLKLISVCKIDNLYTDLYRQDSPHFYLQPFYLQPRDVIERLVRMNQNYKVTVQHALNQGLCKDMSDYEELVLEQIHKIDYLQPWGDLQSDFAVEKSYTWLDWLIIDQVIKAASFERNQMTDEQKLQLASIILPNGTGILHKLASLKDSKSSHINQIAMDLFQLSKQEAQAFLENVDDAVKFEIPVLFDIKKRTALDICLEVKKESHKTSCCLDLKKKCFHPKEYFEDEEKNAEQQSTSRNIMLAGIIFDSIKDYGLLHSSQLVVDAVIKATKIGLPAIKSYLESRIIRAEHSLLPFSHPRLKNKVRRECPAIHGEYGYTTAPIWGKVSDITGDLFKRNRPNQPTKIDTVDLPELHAQVYRGREFIESLTECKDLDFFRLKSVQILIDHHHVFWYKINLMSQVLPAMIQVLLFWVWNNFVLPVRLRDLEMRRMKKDQIRIDAESGKFEEFGIEDKIDIGDADSMLRVMLFVLTGYLFAGEFYITMVNLTRLNSKDLAPKSFVTSVFLMFLHFTVLVSIFGAGDEVITSEDFWHLQSWVAIFVWMRMMFSGAEIREFSWIIGLITYCLKSIVTFSVVYICAVGSLSDALNAVSQGQYIGQILNGEVTLEDIDLMVRTSFEQWVDFWQISFKASLGDFPDAWGDSKHFHYFDWLVFLYACFFLIIIMLNLLISIITKAQDEFTEARVENTYREKALQVRNKGYSFFYPMFAQSDGQASEVLFIVQQASASLTLEIEEEKTMQEQLTELTEKIDGLESFNKAAESADGGDLQQHDVSGLDLRQSHQMTLAKSPHIAGKKKFESELDRALHEFGKPSLQVVRSSDSDNQSASVGSDEDQMSSDEEKATTMRMANRMRPRASIVRKSRA